MKNLLWIAAGWYIGKAIVTLAIIAVTVLITLLSGFNSLVQLVG